MLLCVYNTNIILLSTCVLSVNLNTKEKLFEHMHTLKRDDIELELCFRYRRTDTYK